jgi:transposase InsO family protein
MLLKGPTLPVHLRLRGQLDTATERLALRAALTASHLLGFATGTHLRALRGKVDPLADLQARLEEAELRARLASERADLLAARFAKLPEKRRPYFSPAQRFRILELRALLAWNLQETADAFLVCANTIANWERAADPATRTAGVTVQTVPPTRRAADVVRGLVQSLSRLGYAGQDLVARVLARAGWRVSARSVGRYRRERPLPLPTLPAPTRTARPVVARFVNHVWMMDVSVVKQFLGPSLHVAAAFDAFSRLPLLVQQLEARPIAPDMARLLSRAAKAFGPPRYLITDLGGEFTGRAFRKAVARIGAVHRFAVNDSIKATARLERFWRTLKETAGFRRLGLPLTAGDLERRLELALLYYVCFRPHEGLAGATPAEAFLGTDPAHSKAVEPPRGRPAEGPIEPPFTIEYLDPTAQLFPILIRAA